MLFHPSLSSPRSQMMRYGCALANLLICGTEGKLTIFVIVVHPASCLLLNFGPSLVYLRSEFECISFLDAEKGRIMARKIAFVE
jgi:hypothetical protein